MEQVFRLLFQVLPSRQTVQVDWSLYSNKLSYCKYKAKSGAFYNFWPDITETVTFDNVDACLFVWPKYLLS